MRGRFPWLFGLLVVALLLGMIGAYSYNLGVARGVAESAALAAQGGTVPMPAWPGYYWHGGFGFFPVAPLFFILFGVVLLRGLFWRRRWSGRPGAHWAATRHGCGEVPPAFDEWHRRAHARQDQPLPKEGQA